MAREPRSAHLQWPRHLFGIFDVSHLCSENNVFPSDGHSISAPSLGCNYLSVWPSLDDFVYIYPACTSPCSTISQLLRIYPLYAILGDLHTCVSAHSEMTGTTANAPDHPQTACKCIHRGYRLSNESSIAGALIPSDRPVSQASTKLVSSLKYHNTPITH